GGEELVLQLLLGARDASHCLYLRVGLLLTISSIAWHVKRFCLVYLAADRRGGRVPQRVPVLLGARRGAAGFGSLLGAVLFGAAARLGPAEPWGRCRWPGASG